MAASRTPIFDYWLSAQSMGETLAADADPAGYGRRLQQQRLAQLLAAALSGSPFYRRRHGARAATAPRLEDFEPVAKRQLMQHFDDWATDRRITRAAAEAFVHDPARLADPFLGEYLLWTSSGTTGEPGIFVQDARSLAAYDAIDAVRLRAAGLRRQPMPAWGMGQRLAFVGATGGHFAGNASIERLRRLSGGLVQPLMPAIQSFSVLEPLQQLAARLQAWRPSVLITYPSCAAALALLQAAGGLRLRLAEVWVGGEQLTGPQRKQIGSAFGCPLRNNYGASECFAIAWECVHGRLHLNDDWVQLELLDEHLRPVPAGEPSQVTLLTNLANRTQPLIRYELGDRVRRIETPCRCGSVFPSIEVEGRADDTLLLRDRRARPVTVLPLALMTAIEEGAGVTQFQVVCSAPDVLELRFEADVPDKAAAFARSRDALAAFLARHGLANVAVRHESEAPLRQACSGKLRRVVTQLDARGHAAKAG